MYVFGVLIVRIETSGMFRVQSAPNHHGNEILRCSSVMKDCHEGTKSWRAVSKDAKNRAVSNCVDCPRRKVSESCHVQSCRNVEQSV